MTAVTDNLHESMACLSGREPAMHSSAKTATTYKERTWDQE